MHQLLPLGWEYHVFSPPAQHFPRLVNLLRLRFPWLKGTPPSPGVAAPPGAQRWLGLDFGPRIPWFQVAKSGISMEKTYFFCHQKPGKWLLAQLVPVWQVRRQWWLNWSSSRCGWWAWCPSPKLYPNFDDEPRSYSEFPNHVICHFIILYDPCDIRTT